MVELYQIIRFFTNLSFYLYHLLHQFFFGIIGEYQLVYSRRKRRMNVLKSSGFECEKKMATTLEDLFNQSDVLYEHKGSEKNLNVTYVRYFDQYMQENGIYDSEETGVPFYEVSALLILMKNNGYVDALRLYYNDTDKFLASFNTEDIPEALSIYKKL